MFQAKPEHAPDGAINSSKITDDVLLRLGREFSRVDCQRRGQNRKFTLSERALAKLDRQWWRIAWSIKRSRPTTPEGRRVLAQAVAAVAREVGDKTELERFALALTRSILS